MLICETSLSAAVRPTTCRILTMLLSWIAIQDVVATPKPKPLSPHQETAEQREHRLRAMYEQALILHRNDALEKAQSAFRSLVAELASFATTPSQSARTASLPATSVRPTKRPRVQAVESPLWVLRLRYAALRNLAETCASLGEHTEALYAYSRALDDDPSDFVVWLGAARAASAVGRLHVARRAYEAALAKRPRHWLVLRPYHALLAAIGDDDYDVATTAPNHLSTDTRILVTRHACALADERSAHPIQEGAELLHVDELSWVCLADALRACLERRLAGHTPLLVAHPVRFIAQKLAKPQDGVASVVVSASSDEVILVAETRSQKRKRLSNDPVDVDNMQSGSVEHVPNVQPPAPEVNSSELVILDESAADPVPSSFTKQPDSSGDKKPEVRRSARRANAAAAAAVEAERRTTRIAAEQMHNQREDSEMIQALLQICNEKPATSSAEPAHGDTSLENTIAIPISNVPPGRITKGTEPARASTWKRVVEEHEEAVAVDHCIRSIETKNCGPADLLLRVLTELSKIKVVQYFSTLAMLWLTVRDRLHMNAPGPPDVCVLIVEALLVSGKKASKQKARRFHEASRLLSQVHLSNTDATEYSLLFMRIAWLWGMLHDCRGEMQLSFQAAERALSLARSIRDRFEGAVPELAGPELSGYSWDALEMVVEGRISRLKSARDLEKAQEELRKVGAGDKEAAKRTVSILAPSVYSTVRALQLDRWNANDLKFEFSSPGEADSWDARLEAEIDLEPRLKVLSDACVRADDVVGELVCFSVRLRMAVHYYAAKVRCENEAGSHEKESDSMVDSSSIRITDLLVQVRRYVLAVKKISSSSSSHLWSSKVSPSGWSMEGAATIVASTLVSLTELIITLIPFAKHSSASTELGASQKNRRLGFTRCMLAFPRCIILIHKCRQASNGDNTTSAPVSALDDSALTRKMLYVTSFCLRALEVRGCCREEGTSGALIKLYAKFLILRLQEIASRVHGDVGSQKRDVSVCNENDSNGQGKACNTLELNQDDSKNQPVQEEIAAFDSESSSNFDGIADPNYNWWDVRLIRHELAQCFKCLYQIPELDAISGDSAVFSDVRWLENACQVSKHIGLSFIGGGFSSSVSVMDTEVCRNIYFFYRKRIFEAICLRRRDGGRVKRLREVISRLAETLPEDAPNGVNMLSFQALDTTVSDVVDSNTDISRGAAESVSKLEEEWNRVVAKNENGTAMPRVRDVQLSIMYFEVFSLHALSILDLYESEYKKQKNAERRKRPKEIADRLLTASSECLIALRCRPWSVGAWILLGRIFIEISDLALDERELCFSSFGLYHTEDIASLGDGDSIQTNFGRAEACFGFAESLLRHSWGCKASTERISIDVSLILGSAYDGKDDEPWFGLGDDGDLFGTFGLTNATTSRPMLLREPHPNAAGLVPDSSRLGAIRLGGAALSLLRLRERRYFHIHWTRCTLNLKVLTHPNNQFPVSIVELGSKALDQLTEGLRLYDSLQNDSIDKDMVMAVSTVSDILVTPLKEPKWRTGYCAVSRTKWYYSFLEAKLLRKCGRSYNEYLPVFQRALDENRTWRASQKMACDIEPLYKLHASRMKVLRTMVDNGDSMEVLTTLERFSFNSHRQVVDVDDVADDEDWLTVRRNAVAEDILSAMQSCCENRNGISYAEFFFKATFCKAVLLSDVLKDASGATLELSKLFRIDAAARALDAGPEGIHRGYFYRLWNYRYTDTGVEPALETERKLVRWRSKLLGLYGSLLRQSGEWRALAAIILRLRKRVAEDLPVDGANLDDLIYAYATTRRASTMGSMERGILTDAAAFESSFRTTWHIYAETLRLSQGARRVRLAVMRQEQGDTGEERLVQSGRPRCLVAIHAVLRIEHLRWHSAANGIDVDLAALKALPIEGRMADVDAALRASYVDTLQASAAKWPLDEKLNKMLVKRMNEFMAVSVKPAHINNLPEEPSAS